MASKIYWNTGGEDISLQKYEWFNKNGKDIELPTPIKEGCEFCGWFNYDRNKQTLECIDRISATDMRSFNLYALWKKDGKIVDCYEYVSPKMFENAREYSENKYYGISYYAVVPVKEYIENVNDKYEIGKTHVLPVPKREDYAFGGWYDLIRPKNDNPYLNKIDQIDDSYGKKNFRLYAKWIDSNGNVDNCYVKVPVELFADADKRYIKSRSELEKRRRKDIVDKFLANEDFRQTCYPLENWLKEGLLAELKNKLRHIGFSKENIDIVVSGFSVMPDMIPDMICWIIEQKESGINMKDAYKEQMRLLKKSKLLDE